MEAAMYVPLGKLTVPPPAMLQDVIALLMDDVSLVEPSPVAPKLFTSHVRTGMIGSGGGAGGVGVAGWARAMPEGSRRPNATRAAGANRMRSSLFPTEGCESRPPSLASFGSEGE